MKKLYDKKWNLTVAGVSRMLANPFYAINISPAIAQAHETIVSEDKWIKSAIVSIEQDGAEKFLLDLLENLKWNYV